jgi:hypothetical protein
MDWPSLMVLQAALEMVPPAVDLTPFGQLPSGAKG